MAHADGSFRAASAASPSVLEAALAYASRGWPVFPCGENKHPLTTNGYLDASVDPAVIARWWAAKPDAHVAVACGAAGIFVVDLDEDEAKGKRGGEVFRQFCDTRQHHAAVVARTPRGGRHLFFLQPLEDDAVGSHNDWLSGVDVKGVGGYVLLPSPASHGREWVEGDFRDDLDEPPQWLLDKLPRKRAAQPDVRPSAGGVSHKVTPIDDAQVARIRDALKWIDCEPRQKWRNVGMALKSTGAWDQAYELWVEWSQQSSKFDAKVQRKQWNSFKEFRTNGTEITLGSLFHMAKEAGWNPQTEQNESSIFDVPDDHDDEGATESSAPGDAPPKQLGSTPSEVVASWRRRGPLLKLPTGFPALDEATRGGITAGAQRVLLNGAPDSGKTMLLAQWADEWAQAGHAVAFLAIDEEADDLVARFLQRRGVGRRDIEHRVELDTMANAVGGAPFLRIVDAEQLEDANRAFNAAMAAAKKAGEPCKVDSPLVALCRTMRAHADEQSGRAAVLLVDSVHALANELLPDAREPRMAIDKSVRFLKRLALKFGVVVVATGEMNRASYRSEKSRREQHELAAGAESRSLEFWGRLVINCRSVRDEGGLVELTLAKNKLGGETPNAPIVLSMSKARQELRQSGIGVTVDPEVGARAAEALKDEERRARILDAAGKLRFMVAREALASMARGKIIEMRKVLDELVQEGVLVQRRRHGKDVFGLPTTPLEDPDAKAAPGRPTADGGKKATTTNGDTAKKRAPRTSRKAADRAAEGAA